MKHSYRVGGKDLEIEIVEVEEGYHARVEGRDYSVVLLGAKDDALRLLIDGKPHSFILAAASGLQYIAFEGKTFVLRAPPRRPASSRTIPEPSEESVMRAPMPGQVRAVHAKPGDLVERGQTVVLLEAMKMEIRIQAPRAGRLELVVKEGDLVERDQVLGQVE